MLLISLVAAFTNCKKDPKSFTVTTRMVNKAVYASGEIMPAEYELVKATSNQRLLRVLVRQGDTVKGPGAGRVGRA